MRRLLQSLMMAGTATAVTWSLLAPAQIPQTKATSDFVKDFVLPDYYPTSNGVRRLKTRVSGTEARIITNGVFALKEPRLESYREDGTTLEWVAVSPECTVDMKTRSVRGATNMFFQTADEQMFLSGVGFLWQQTNSVLILSNQTHTWIDKKALTNSGPMLPKKI